MEMQKQAYVTEDMTVGEVIEKYPIAAEVFGRHGLSCIGCSVNTMESVGLGARGHGMSDEEVSLMVKEANEAIAKEFEDRQAEQSQQQPKTTSNTGTITLSEAAAKKVSDLLNSQSKLGWGLRVGVNAGGCSGFTYKLDFEEAPQKGDIVLESHNVKVFVDPKSMQKLDGTKIDYVDGLQGAGFKIDNPNAHGGCGCGKSFS